MTSKDIPAPKVPSERFCCPICSGRNIEIETVMLGGVVRYDCTDCGWSERHDPRQKGAA